VVMEGHLREKKMMIDQIEVFKKEINERGRPKLVDAVRIGEKIFFLRGDLVKTARIREEWFEDVENPEEIIEVFKNKIGKADLFTFIQRLPEKEPKYKYYMEMEKVTALPIISYEHWWEKQISSDTRKKAKRAYKRGVEIKIVPFDDDLVRGISGIFDEEPVRQGRPFWHYKKDFETVKKEMSLDLDICDFIGAYADGELIGIIKLLYAEKVAEPVIIVSKNKYRDRYVNNALIAKAVEMCEKRGVPFITYGSWRRGNQADFLRRNGFERLMVPRYFVPLSLKGRIALKLKLHWGIKERIPEKLLDLMRDLRKRWYMRNISNKVENE
jgi:N-acetylglutamate synthase-like GNAT family acetyltransferase